MNFKQHRDRSFIADQKRCISSRLAILRMQAINGLRSPDNDGPSDGEEEESNIDAGIFHEINYLLQRCEDGYLEKIGQVLTNAGIGRIEGIWDTLLNTHILQIVKNSSNWDHIRETAKIMINIAYLEGLNEEAIKKEDFLQMVRDILQLSCSDLQTFRFVIIFLQNILSSQSISSMLKVKFIRETNIISLFDPKSDVFFGGGELSSLSMLVLDQYQLSSDEKEIILRGSFSTNILSQDELEDAFWGLFYYLHSEGKNGPEFILFEETILQKVLLVIEYHDISLESIRSQSFLRPILKSLIILAKDYKLTLLLLQSDSIQVSPW